VEVPVEVVNRGDATWPGALSANGGARGEIFIAARWRPVDRPDEHPVERAEDLGAPGAATVAVGDTDVGLRRDLPGGESLRQVLPLFVPASGAAERVLELRLGQRTSEGARLVDGRTAVVARINARSP